MWGFKINLEIKQDVVSKTYYFNTPKGYQRIHKKLRNYPPNINKIVYK